MASSKEYLEFVLDQLSLLEEVSHKAMMGEYIIYYQGKVIGGIYDDRFLVKQTKSENVDDRDFLKELFEAMVGELPAPKQKASSKHGK